MKIRYTFNLPLRQTQGFIDSLFSMMDLPFILPRFFDAI
ncbi:transposase [Shewanella surugensis]